MGSRAQVQRLCHTGLVASRPVESSWNRDRTTSSASAGGSLTTAQPGKSDIHFLIGKLLSSYKMRIRYLKYRFSALEGEVSVWLPGWGWLPHPPYLHLPCTILAETQDEVSGKTYIKQPRNLSGQAQLTSMWGSLKMDNEVLFICGESKARSCPSTHSTCGSQHSAPSELHLWLGSIKRIPWLLLAVLSLHK